MLTQAPPAASQYTPPPPGQRADDISGHAHRQAIGYLGLALPILLVQVERLRPNALSDNWSGNSISAYYWTGAVSLFVGLLAALSLFLLTYRGYANESHKYDRAAAIIAGVAAAFVALFPTSPPSGIVPPWWREWISATHAAAAITLFSTFAVFSLWLFRKTAPGEQPTADKKRRNAIYLLCGIAIVASMVWAVVEHRLDRSIFWPESSALVFFAWSWLVKGQAVRSIKSTVGAAKSRVGSSRMRAIIALVAVGLFAACVHHPSTSRECPPVGRWTLRSINGAALPFTMGESGAYRAQMISVTLDVGSDGRFTITSHRRESLNGQASDETSPDTGTWVLAGERMTLHFQSDGKTSSALLSCETLTMQERGGTYVFKR
jgi:hypothetical protein